ncbi:hypothetical protein [Roseobacter sp. A03A-229]
MGNFWNPFRREETPQEGVFIVAQLNAKLGPMERFDHFEEPLQEILQERGIGEVTGGGTMLLGDHAGIDYCDLEILVREVSPDVLQTLRVGLETLGAPKGSLLKTDGRDDMPFGTTEGLGLFLNGTDLPDEVYATSDVNEVIDSCDRLMEGIGAFRGHWDGPTETGLFFYGQSYEAMKSVIMDFTDAYPLCARARFEQVA